MPRVLEIAVVGAGVGGLAFASFAAREGHRVTLFDQFETPRPIGSGLVIQPVGQAVLAKLGALEAATTTGHKIWDIIGVDVSSGLQALGLKYGDAGSHDFGLSIHRGALFHALYSRVPNSVDFRPSSRCVGCQNGLLQFERGASAGPFDLIVDASGSGSKLSPLRSKELPFGALWASVDAKEGTFEHGILRQRYMRAEKMLGLMPMGRLAAQKSEKLAVFWSLPKSQYEAWYTNGIESWLEEANEIWPEYAEIAKGISDPSQMTLARYSHGTLKIPARDNIAFIGDAAHRASPQLGQGANMALLDAYALSRALRLAREDVFLALHYYVYARRWHIWFYQVMSWAFTPMYQSESRVLPILRDRLLFPTSKVWPLSSFMAAMVRGDLVPPLGSLTPRAGFYAGRLS